MNRILKVIEPPSTTPAYQGPHQEIANYVRTLLKCDYALVAVPEKDSIRIQGFACRGGATYQELAAELTSRLRDWGPVVVDDARLIAAPVSRGSQVLGVLIGYSSTPGTFTADDLDKLMTYTHVAAGILGNAVVEKHNDDRTFTKDEMLHVSRLITLGELSTCFAHEVTNPLMLIRGHLRVIREILPADHPLRNNFDVIERASVRIEELSRRMLDFSRRRAHRTELCELAELISEAVRFVQPHFRSTCIDLQVHVDPRAAVIDVDRWQMVQALVNLFQNAADAMADVTERVLTVTAELERGQVKLVVSDTGMGIAPSIQSKIFEPFFSTKGEQGTGLGLYITKQVIEAHHGTIEVRSTGCGTSFIIGLPL
jgi:signal transduction histidine kinase